VDETEDRSRGYFEAKLDIDPASNGCGPTGNCAIDEKIFLLPKPPPGHIVAAFIWDETLSNYLDAWLYRPDKIHSDGHRDVAPRRIGYTNQNQHTLSAEPWSKVICDSNGNDDNPATTGDNDNDPTDCGSFYTAPELFIFKWGGGEVCPHDGWGGAMPAVHNFIIDGYGCPPGTDCRPQFESVNGRVYIAFTNPSHCDQDSGGAYGDGCSSNADCGGGTCAYFDFCTGNGERCTSNADCGGGSCLPAWRALNGGDPIKAANASGTGKYWNVFQWHLNACGDPWGSDIHNEFTNRPPWCGPGGPANLSCS
jgi:hypothetical protein